MVTGRLRFDVVLVLALVCRGAAAQPQIAAGVDFTCLLSRDGHVRCWGDNALGQLTGSDRPHVVEGLDQVKQLVAGHSQVCALRADASVWCWGSNWQGELGAGTDARVDSCPSEPCSRRPLPVPGIRARSIAAGGGTSCAALEDGGVACWGDAQFKQIPGARERCTTSNVPCAKAPVAIKGVTDAVQVAVGGWHVCALRKTGQLLCWGGNEHGQVGADRTGNALCARDYLCVPAPTPVAGVVARQVVAGPFHTCALEQDGHVACWGRDDDGALGGPPADETCRSPLGARYPCSSKPQRVRALARVARLAPGGSCAIADDDRLYCWGDDRYGQLGVGGAAGRCRVNGEDDLPCARGAVLVEGAGSVTDAAASVEHACSIRRDGRVFCWGSDAAAQSGGLPRPIDLCIHIPPDQKTPCLRRPREVSPALAR
jgi:alpha-tubulin suppressor-like RCC1 family protein